MRSVNDVRFLSAAIFAVVALVAVAPGRATTSEATAAPLSQSQVIKRFAQATGRTLAVDRGASRPGHYTVLRLSSSVTNTATYGEFKLFLVAPGTLDADTRQLLLNVHTGELGSPAAGGIYWEQTRLLSGGTVWLGKKRYGQNLVLWHYGPIPKVDPTFKRLHKALTKVVAG